MGELFRKIFKNCEKFMEQNSKHEPSSTRSCNGKAD